jgi:transcriptional repressor NrdR
MRCPYCRHADSRVVDSREVDEGQVIRRRRSCQACGRRFTTVEEATLAVIKRSGVTEPFSRTKVINGVRRACQGRPVDEDALALLAQRVEDAVRATGCAEIPSNEVGLAILGPLRELDEVAYLRFASVYRSFESIEDFEAEIEALRRPPADRADPGPPAGRPPDRRQGRTGTADPPRSPEPTRPELSRTDPVRREGSRPDRQMQPLR